MKAWEDNKSTAAIDICVFVNQSFVKEVYVPDFTEYRTTTLIVPSQVFVYDERVAMRSHKYFQFELYSRWTVVMVMELLAVELEEDTEAQYTYGRLYSQRYQGIATLTNIGLQ